MAKAAAVKAAADKVAKEAARASAKAVTGDAFKKGIKSGIGSLKVPTSKTVTGETLKRAAGRLTDSDYLKTAIKPGISSAFQQAGGRAGAARRIVGGAAIGGATTGTIGALRGNDFWESSKSGAVMGAVGGAGRQVKQMGRTEVGSELASSVRGELSTARREANVSYSVNEALNKFDGKGMSSKGMQASAEALATRKAKAYQSSSFMDNAKADVQATVQSRANMRAEKKSSGQAAPTRKQTNQARQGKSNQVVTLERANMHADMSNSILGNPIDRRKRRGAR